MTAENERAYAFDNALGAQRERLRTLERILDPGTIGQLEARGVQRGWRCLEFGAGGGSIAAWLCDRVAPDGAVVATDLDTTVLEEVAHPDLDEDDLPEGEAKRGAGSGRCRSRSCATG